MMYMHPECVQHCKSWVEAEQQRAVPTTSFLRTSINARYTHGVYHVWTLRGSPGCAAPYLNFLDCTSAACPCLLMGTFARLPAVQRAAGPPQQEGVAAAARRQAQARLRAAPAHGAQGAPGRGGGPRTNAFHHVHRQLRRTSQPRISIKPVQ